MVGAQGLVLSSSDLQVWKPQECISRKSLYGAMGWAGQLVCVGLEGAILRARSAPFEESVGIVKFERAGGENAFLFGGARDQRFRLDHSLDLSDWTPAVELEMTDSAGTLLHFQATNGAPRQFYRALELKETLP